MDIQKDWDKAIKKPEEKFWVLLKRAGLPTVHGYLWSPLSVQQKQEEEDKFMIKEWSDKRLEVECTVTNTVTSFIAPQTTLSLSAKRLLSMDISPSGELGVCSSDNGQLWVWDTDNGETKRVLAGHIGDVDTCRFFPSGMCVLSGGSDFRVKIWSVPDGKCPRTLTGHTRGITDTCIIERVIASSYDGTVRLWECGSGQCISILTSISSTINGCGLVTDSSLVSPTKTDPDKHEYNTDGKLLFITSDDCHLRLFDVRNRTKVNEYIHQESALTRGVSIGRERVIVGSEDGDIILLDLRNIMTPLKTFPLIKSPVTSLLSYNKDQLIVGYKNGVCIIWNYSDPVPSARLTGTDIDPVTAIATSAQSHVTYTSCRDGCVRAYHL